MPSSPNYQRNYKAEYQNYQGRADQIKKRVERNKAHKMLEELMGAPVKRGSDVDHITPLAKGGSNTQDNLRILPASKNRSFRRNQNAEML